MRRLGLVTVILVASLISLADAGEIKLKFNLITGWKYSRNDGVLMKAGYTGKHLRMAMAGNDEAQAKMDTYSDGRTAAAFLGFVGTTLVGYSLYQRIDRGGWTKSDETRNNIGLGLGLASFLLDLRAMGHMKEAVRIYNGDEQSVGFDVKWRRGYASTDNGTLVVGLAWSF